LYDKVLWLDDSCIVGQDAENLFDLVALGSIGGVSMKIDKAKKADYAFIKSTKKFEININKYLNSGIIVYTKQIRQLFSAQNIVSHKQLFASSYPHQAYLNYVLQANNVPIVCLNNKYNDCCLDYNYNTILNNSNTTVDSGYIETHSSSIFHITGWWLHRFKVLQNIDQVLSNRDQVLSNRDQVLPKSGQVLPKSDQVLPKSAQVLSNWYRVLPTRDQVSPFNSSAYWDGRYKT
jgi:hypothetical protein